MIISDLQYKLARWAADDPDRRFDRCLRLIAHQDWLAEAARIVLASRGSKTPGVDGITRDSFLLRQDHHLTQLREELLEETYTPLPTKRVYIPKANGKLRPLGIPTIKDRIVQRAMLMAMEPIWESDFSHHSYGFRPQRSVHHAVRNVKTQLTDWKYTRGRWVIEGDLASYFDTVHHRKLVSCVRKRIRDRRFIALLWRILKSGHIDDGLFRAASEGVPQGGVLSPLLSNIMLHEFDRWMEAKYLSKKVRYQRAHWNKGVRQAIPVAVRESREWKPSVSYCRYADDFVLIVKGTKAHAETVREHCRDFLENELKLTLNMDKTHITHVNDGFIFLGHRIIRKRGSNGRMRPVTTIPEEKIKAFRHRLVTTLSGNHNMAPEVMIDALNAQITGWASFYKFVDHAGKAFQNINSSVFWKLAHWLGRKYRSRIKPLLRKWFRRPKGQTAKTWIISRRNNEGKFVTRSLCRLRKGHDMSFCNWKTPHANHYLREGRTADLFRARFCDLKMAFSQT